MKSYSLTFKLLLKFAIASGVALLSTSVARADACNTKLQPGDKCTVELAELRPTQGGVGMRGVGFKKKKFDKVEAEGKDALKKYMKDHRVEVVIGPGGQYYLVDGHHHALGALQAGLKNIDAEIKANLSSLTPEKFWAEMQNKKWVRLKDANGKAILPSQLPLKLSELKDDPYRSFADSVLKAGAIVEEDAIPFFEFEWADYYRDKISKAELDQDWDAAVKKGITLAFEKDAAKLPGARDIKPKDLPDEVAECWKQYLAVK